MPKPSGKVCGPVGSALLSYARGACLGGGALMGGGSEDVCS